ncbi:HNH endonuclease [Singulisphaera sp. PoT]|uniref:HNH endonuclease n=1 Tax=Singulisphaera sp. PoT TaxID=3411797 RepID=UPI003BF58D60
MRRLRLRIAWIVSCRPHHTSSERGGSNWPDNLQILCQTCNTEKHTKTMEEFMQLRAERL